MAKYFYASSFFPFTKVFPLGMALVIIGVVSIAFGIVDLIYTSLKYDSNTCNNDLYVGWKCPDLPCDSRSINLAKSASGIWCGALMAIAGGLSTSLIYASASTIRVKRDVTAAFTGILSLPLGPTAFLLCIFRLDKMNGSFFCTNDGKLTVTDHMELLMTIFTLILELVGWALAIVTLVMLLRRGTLMEGSDQQPGYAPRHPSVQNLGQPADLGVASSIFPDMSPGWQDRTMATYDNQLSGKVYPYLAPGPVDGAYMKYPYPGPVPSSNPYSQMMYSRY